MSNLHDYAAAQSGKTWEGYDGQRVMDVPARIKPRFWISEYAGREPGRRFVVHIARPEGLVHWHGDHSEIRPIFYCAGSLSRPVPVDLEATEHRVCAGCQRQCSDETL